MFVAYRLRFKPNCGSAGDWCVSDFKNDDETCRLLWENCLRLTTIHRPSFIYVQVPTVRNCPIRTTRYTSHIISKHRNQITSLDASGDPVTLLKWPTVRAASQ
ncbi:uncharacterized protein LOC129749559 [Uranotaenia lowii]|uniref:uncharacterized protein LOC129749559 n=1 Tax=Uranotaenia lowii TaxID=190385 RepID=UPI0024788DA5|nr:uncharacterized protein LOC129749559 [Uranotaenia lowii]